MFRISHDIDECFGEDYADARLRFLDAAARVKAEHHDIVHPDVGPKFETLAMDVARFGPRHASKIILIGSGTHGVEGYCGSGIQVSLIKSGALEERPADTTVIFLHGINPWGFAHGRRVNEDNVDVNRNFLTHEGTYPVNEGYEALYGAFNPHSLDETTLAKGRRDMAAFAAQHGAAALQKAFSAGQYRHPKGVQFGGHKPIWSNEVFEEQVWRQCAEAEQIVFLDLHSGLGAKGACEIISTTSPDQPAFARAQQWWGAEVKSTKAEGSVSSDVSGSISDAVHALLAPRQITAVGLEFGTTDAKEVMEALIAENCITQHGDPESTEGRAARQRLKNAFYPADDSEWKHAIVKRSQEIFRATFQGLTQ